MVLDPFARIRGIIFEFPPTATRSGRWRAAMAEPVGEGAPREELAQVLEALFTALQQALHHEEVTPLSVEP